MLLNSSPAFGAGQGLWGRIRDAAVDAALEPGTWAPLAGAAILRASKTDEEVSNWISTHRPIFKSRENAGKWSDYLAASAYAANLITTLAVPKNTTSQNSSINKLRLFQTSIIAGALTFGSTNLIKSASNRLRPDLSDYKSFPSGHTSIAAVNLTLASHNLDYMPLSNTSRIGLKIGFNMLTLGTAWARVEANKHYLSDVLAGAAIGHFFGSFASNLILGKKKKGFTLSINPFDKSAMIYYRIRF